MEKITFEQLPEAVALILEKIESIEHTLSKQGSSEVEDVLNIAQAAKFLDLSVATIYSKVCRRELPVNKKGKRIYFYRSELTDWIKKGRRRTLWEVREGQNFQKSLGVKKARKF